MHSNHEFIENIFWEIFIDTFLGLFDIVLYCFSHSYYYDDNKIIFCFELFVFYYAKAYTYVYTHALQKIAVIAKQKLNNQHNIISSP